MKQALFVGCLVLLALVSCQTTSHKRAASELATVQQIRKRDYAFLEAVRLKQSKKYDAAFETLQYCMVLDSMHAPTLFELSTFYSSFGMPEKAEQLLLKAIEQAPSNKWYNLALSQTYIKKRAYEKAIPILETLSKNDKTDLSLVEMLINLYKQTKAYQKAIDQFSVLEELMGQNEQITLAKFELYMRLKKPQSAVAEIDRLKRAFPDNLHYKLLKGDLLLSINEPEQAYAVYKALEKEVGANNKELLLGLLNYAFATNKAIEPTLDKALLHQQIALKEKDELLLRYLDRLDEKDSVAVCAVLPYLEQKLMDYPELVQTRSRYALLLALVQRMPEAIEQTRIVMKYALDKEDIWEELYKKAVKQGNYQQMLIVAQTALKYHPENVDMMSNKALSFSLLKQPDQALKSVLTAIELAEKQGVSTTKKSEIYGMLGDIYQEKKNDKGVVDAYEQALKYNRRNINVLNNYSYYLSVKKKDLAKAEKMIALCLKMVPDYPTFIDTYAWIFFQQKNYSLALFYIERAFSLNIEKNSEVCEHYGDILYKNGQKEKALEMWKEALKLDGKYSQQLKQKIATKEYVE